VIGVVRLRRRGLELVGLRWRAGLGIAVVAVILGVGACSQSQPSSPEEAVDAYIAALNDSDREALAALVPEHVDASDDLGDKLNTLGGQHITLSNVDVSSDVDIRQAIAHLRGTRSDGEYSESLYLFSEDGRWYVDMEQPAPEKD
jgi:hypothetical protein